MKKLYTVAFDLGGVIFSSHNDIFQSNYIETELTPGMYDVVVELSKKENFKLIVISKAYPTNARKSKAILKLYGLDDYFNSIIFCENNDSKAEIAKAMNVDVMIDDKKEVLDKFNENIKTILFDPSKVGCLLSMIVS